MSTANMYIQMADFIKHIPFHSPKPIELPEMTSNCDVNNVNFDVNCDVNNVNNNVNKIRYLYVIVTIGRFDKYAGI